MVEFLAFSRIPRERFHAEFEERRRKAERAMHELDEITRAIVDSAIQIHSKFGPGLLESVHEAVLAQWLVNRGFAIERQKTIGFEHEGISFDNAFRLDMLVDDRVIVEIKSIEQLAPVHTKQLLTYLRLTDLHVGLLINFGGATLKEGLRRIVNRLPPSASPHLRVNRLP
jgi:iron complex transport system substrate-binding protein